MEQSVREKISTAIPYLVDDIINDLKLKVTGKHPNTGSDVLLGCHNGQNLLFKAQALSLVYAMAIGAHDES